MTTEPRTMDLPDRVLEIARREPERVALIHVRPGRRGRASTTTYARLSHRAESTAVGLREIGVREGTLCSFMVPPGEDAMVLALALWRMGAVMVGIEPHSHGLRPVARSLARVGPEVFFGTPEAHVARVAFGWGRGTVRTKIVVGGPSLPGVRTLASLERPWLADPTPATIAPDDPAVIAFTTGSTGNPKPTVMTHANLTAMMDGVVEQWGLTEFGDVVDMPTFPMFWIIGLAHGGTVVVPPMNFATKGPASASPAKLVRTITDHDVRSLFASPALLTNLANWCNQRHVTLGSVRRVVCGGAEVNGPLFAEMRKVLVNGEMYSDYGATEALPVAEIDGTTVTGETWPLTETGAGVCVGTPLAGVEVSIVDIVDGPISSMEDARILAPGDIGEVVVRSPHVSDHYYDAPDEMVDNKIEDTRSPGEDGSAGGRWHRLGDCGYLDDDGRLWVCGRRSHRVVTPQRTWYPLCCEPVVNADPDVVRSALIGSRSGAALCVELVPQARERRATVEQRLRDLVDTHEATKGIERFVFVDRLPVDRRHNAKIDRPALTAEYGS